MAAEIGKRFVDFKLRNQGKHTFDDLSKYISGASVGRIRCFKTWKT